MNEVQVFDSVAFARQHVDSGVQLIYHYDLIDQDTTDEDTGSAASQLNIKTLSQDEIRMYLHGCIGQSIEQALLEEIDGNVSVAIDRINALQREYDPHSKEWSKHDYADYDDFWADFLETGWSEGIAGKIVEKDYPNLFATMEDQIKRILLKYRKEDW